MNSTTTSYKFYFLPFFFVSALSGMESPSGVIVEDLQENERVENNGQERVIEATEVHNNTLTRIDLVNFEKQPKFRNVTIDKGKYAYDNLQGSSAKYVSKGNLDASHRNEVNHVYNTNLHQKDPDEEPYLDRWISAAKRGPLRSTEEITGVIPQLGWQYLASKLLEKFHPDTRHHLLSKQDAIVEENLKNSFEVVDFFRQVISECPKDVRKVAEGYLYDINQDLVSPDFHLNLDKETALYKSLKLKQIMTRYIPCILKAHEQASITQQSIQSTTKLALEKDKQSDNNNHDQQLHALSRKQQNFQNIFNENIIQAIKEMRVIVKLENDPLSTTRTYLVAGVGAIGSIVAGGIVGAWYLAKLVETLGE